jgi:hypothetical protein
MFIYGYAVTLKSIKNKACSHFVTFLFFTKSRLQIIISKLPNPQELPATSHVNFDLNLSAKQSYRSGKLKELDQAYLINLLKPSGNFTYDQV